MSSDPGHKELQSAPPSHEAEAVVVHRARRGEKVLSHLREYRGWYIGACAFAIFLIIFLPIFFLVAIPAIIQHTIDQATLPISNGTLAPLNASAVRLGFTTELSTPSGTTVYLEPFTLDLYNPDTNGHPAFASLAVPGHRLSGRSAIEVPAQDVQVRDTAELSMFLARAFAAPEVTSVGARAEGAVARLAASRYSVRLDKQVTLAGLRGLEGVRIMETAAREDYIEEGEEEKEKADLGGSLEVPNSSPLTVRLGNVTYSVLAGGVQIGQALTRDLELQPGNQTLEFEAVTDADSVIAHLEEVLGEMEDGVIGFTVVGERATVNGEHIPYLDAVLTNVTVAGGLPFCEAMKIIPMEKLPLTAISLIDFDLLMECDI
ncbi:hypothetical protein M406DRAFT_66190 [Cryphonectria parasitica EP155]|uniref:Uncharacterized protein n=1 Tax=Cryphonectria parasitica (strain ATCC 38755 / EP155) TaxID=660469 RepID=A0A9P4Y9Z6_CRYP1|nr:uncharacterized protein M406DRAFT_66190 [Cryphonectria parasitica EP155]KAF3769719.1 hypothetical protein M406DRAFT_66190 [Cryphonectria parasitica EP155]